MFDPSNVALLMTKLIPDEVYTKFRLQGYITWKECLILLYLGFSCQGFSSTMHKSLHAFAQSMWCMLYCKPETLKYAHFRVLEILSMHIFGQKYIDLPLREQLVWSLRDTSRIQLGYRGDVGTRVPPILVLLLLSV